MFDAPTRFEQQEARLRTFATANETVDASIIACLRALYHLNGWEDLGSDDVRSLVGVTRVEDLAQWLRARGHDARVEAVDQYRVDDILWWMAPPTGPARFVICRGDQPGRRVAYWDPHTGQAHWHLLEEQAPGQASGEVRVRIYRPVPPPPPRRPRSWLGRLLGW